MNPGPGSSRLFPEARGSSSLAVGLALAWVAFASPAFATWPHDPSANLPLTDIAGPYFLSVTRSQTIPDGAGGVYSAWVQALVATDRDFHIQRVTSDGVIATGWPTTGLNVCTFPSRQELPILVPDGSGGVIAVWRDNRAGNFDIYAQHVLADATLDPGWPADGLALVADIATQTNHVAIADGAGGVIVAWEDSRGLTPSDIYIQHVDAGGTIHAGWPVGGFAGSAAVGSQNAPAIASDGADGALVAWQDARAGVVDIYLTRFDGAGLVPGWIVDGNPVCVAVGAQTQPQILGDGAGGAYVCWRDFRGIDEDIYIQSISSAGTPGTGWVIDGFVLCAAPGTQTNPRIANHGLNVLACWEDYRGATADLYVAAINDVGVVSPVFPVDGLGIVTAPGLQTSPLLLEDGAGGAIAAWLDTRSAPFTEVYATRIGPSGTTVAGWAAGGVAVALGAQCFAPSIASDGNEGAIIGALSLGLGPVVQNIERFGRLGEPWPHFDAVRDVSGDQGGKVRLSWDASYLDTSPEFPIDSYGVWRRVSAAVAQAAIQRGARCIGATEESAASRGRVGDPAQAAAPSPRTDLGLDGARDPEARGDAARIFRVVSLEAVVGYWEFVASLPARGLPGYSYIVETPFDSTSTSNRQTGFMIEAGHSSSIAFWLSPADSGYSVDNLSPASPVAFSAQYFPASSASRSIEISSADVANAPTASAYTWLHWAPSSERDFLEYRLHRSPTPDFVPGPGNLVIAKPDTGYVDVGAPPSYYKLVAVDAHGNQSVASAALPTGLTGVTGGESSLHLSFQPVAPNPATEEAVFRFTLPRRAGATLTVYDASGRRVRELRQGPQDAGPHAAQWNGRAEDGRRVPPGVYLVRLDSSGQTATRRFTMMR